jgi:hypothetical protein
VVVVLVMRLYVWPNICLCDVIPTLLICDTQLRTFIIAYCHVYVYMCINSLLHVSCGFENVTLCLSLLMYL